MVEKFTRLPREKVREVIASLPHDSIPGDEIDILLELAVPHTLREVAAWLRERVSPKPGAPYARTFTFAELIGICGVIADELEAAAEGE